MRAASTDDDRVHTVLKFVPEDEIQVYMRATDAVVLPFDSALTSSNTVLAMTFGRAVVAPLLTCLPELVGSGGRYLYDPTETERLSTTLRETIDDRDRLQAMGRRNREAAEEFDWNRVAEWTQGVYALELERPCRC